MGYASQSGRARTSASNPQAHAICDRCGFRYNFVDLSWQFEWRGATLQNIKILVCNTCLDKPQENLRAIVIPADPTPIVNARVQDFVAASTDDLTLSTAVTVTDPTTGIPVPPTTTLVTEDGSNLTTQPIGLNPSNVGDGLEQGALMPQFQTTAYSVLLPVISVIANGTTTIAVTCSAVHGLTTGAFVSVLGLTNNAATGFYNVTVTTATAFTYQISPVTPIAAGSLLTSTTRIVTAYLTVPYGYIQIPQTGK